MGKIVVAPENCTGCKACMMVCSLVQEKAPSYRKARIRIKKKEEIEEATPILCRQCDEAPCMDACPVSAIRRNERNEVLLFSDECTGCQLCMEACPHGAIFFDADRGVAFKCNLCGGEPACVTMCQLPQAIRYES
ncbi:4Fe-4S dicluster domain-containing protein [Moorellaceae bacterium AZ2]